ncbi:MAG: hypothetical protein Q8K63_06255 [Acidimicrobiales bacterium]|nr:hypothetical protein [Acidimicrobiales bacterium]
MTGEAIVRLRAPAGPPDRYKNPTLDWANAARLEIPGCAVAPRLADEVRDNGRQAVIKGLTIYAPPKADVVATDRVECRGDTYDVDGDVAVWRSPFTGVEKGVEISLRLVEG